MEPSHETPPNNEPVYIRQGDYPFETAQVRPYYNAEFVTTSPARFPKYFRAHPEARELYKVFEKQRAETEEEVKKNLIFQEVPYFVTRRFLSEPLSYDSFLKSVQNPPSTDQLLKTHLRTSFLSKRARIIRDYVGSTIINSYRAEQIFKGEDNQPDLNTGEMRDVQDKYSSALLALQLAQQTAKDEELNKLITNPAQLETYSQKKGVKLDFDALRTGFVTLVSRELMTKLVENKLVQEESLHEIYDRSSDWLTMIAQYSTSHNKDIKHVLPYPTSIDKENYPDIYFLPYLAKSYVRYSADIQKFVLPGQVYDSEVITTSIKHLQELVLNVYRQHLKNQLGMEDNIEKDFSFEELYKKAKTENPEAASDVDTVNGLLQNYNKTIREIMIYYRQKPYLLNRSNPRSENQRELENYNSWRQRILDSGGRAPVKPTTFRFRHSVRHREN